MPFPPSHDRVRVVLVRPQLECKASGALPVFGPKCKHQERICARLKTIRRKVCLSPHKCDWACTMGRRPDAVCEPWYVDSSVWERVCLSACACVCTHMCELLKGTNGVALTALLFVGRREFLQLWVVSQIQRQRWQRWLTLTGTLQWLPWYTRTPALMAEPCLIESSEGMKTHEQLWHRPRGWCGFNWEKRKILSSDEQMAIPSSLLNSTSNK